MQLGDWFFAVPEELSSITRGPIFPGFLVAKSGDTHRSPLFSLESSHPDFFPFFIQVKEGKLILGFHTKRDIKQGVASEKLLEFIAEGQTFKTTGCWLYYPSSHFEGFFSQPDPETLIKRPLDEAVCRE